MPRIYIAGPMTGLPHSNYPAFHAAAGAWRAKGWEVENPAEHFGGAEDRTYVEYVEADIVDLQVCDAIAMLPAWDAGHSGAIWERAIAVHLLKIPVYDAEQPVEPWRADDDPRAGEIMMADYDEVREFQKWRKLKAETPNVPPLYLMPEPVQDFLREAIPTTAPLTRHPITGALGRWVF
jgi:hypothetical protein